MAVAAAFHLQLLLFSSFLFVSCYSLSESETLLKFKASLKNATRLKDWENNPKPPCQGHRANWAGVVCMNDSVLGLQLENMGLSGTIDVDTLSGFSNLKTLSFMNNNFEGPLPNFKKLKLLKSLYLSKNKFSGDIPANAFEGLIRMMKLYLSDNKFIGPIPSSITKLPKLKELLLDGNGFSGQIPDLKQENLKKVDVSNNKLEGSIPERLSKMNPTWFSDNKGLCGEPLKKCDSPSPSPTPTPTPSAPRSPPSPPSPPRSPTPSPDQPRKKSSIWLIVILFKVGAVLIFFVLIVLLIRWRRSQPLQSLETPPHASGNQDAENLKLSFLRDDRERFDLAELLKSAAEVLGSGSFGSSYKAALTNGAIMVVKRHQKMNNAVKEEFQEHMKSIGRLRHNNLLPIIAYYYRKEEKLIVADYVENGSLAVYLHGHQSLGQPALTWPIRLNIVKGVAKGLEYLYKALPNLVAPHGHLKSSNVLLDESLQPLLTDYGLIPVINQESAQELIVAYKSPEYTKYGRITKKTDVWSLGVLILEILTGKFPANLMGKGKGTDEQDLALWVKSKLGNDLENMSKIVEVFDREMRGIRDNNDKEVMVELLKIGLSCCEMDVDKRLDLISAVERIEGLKVEEYDYHDYDDSQSSLSSEDVKNDRDVLL